MRTLKCRSFPREGVARPDASLAVVAATALLAIPVAVPRWVEDPIFSLGLLVAPWVAWRVLREPRGEGAHVAWRAAALAGAVGFAALGWFARSLIASVAGFAFALLVVALERGATRRAALPVALLALTAPPPGFDSLLVAAQVAVAKVSGGVLTLLGMSVVREAWLLKTPSYTFIIAPVCTGLSGLLATTALVGIVATHREAPARRVALALAAGAAAAILLNVARIVLVVGAAEAWGAEFAEAAFHATVGLLLALAGFALALPLLGGRTATP